MNATAPQTLVGRSKPKGWPIFVLIPSTALLIYMTFEMMRLPSLDQVKLPAMIKGLGPNGAAVFFGGCALICVIALVLMARRAVWPFAELILDKNGVTSNVMWGRGHLDWNAITHVKAERNWFFVYGTDRRGKKRRLIVDLDGLDQPPQMILQTIHDRRPDLMDRI